MTVAEFVKKYHKTIMSVLTAVGLVIGYAGAHYPQVDKALAIVHLTTVKAPCPCHCPNCTCNK